MNTPRAIAARQTARRERRLDRHPSELHLAIGDTPRLETASGRPGDGGDAASHPTRDAARKVRSIDDLPPDDLAAIIQDMMLGGDHPSARAAKAGFTLQDYGRLIALPETREALSDSADLFRVHHFALVSRLRDLAARKLERLLLQRDPKLSPLRSTKVMIDLCVEIMKFPEPE